MAAEGDRTGRGKKGGVVAAPVNEYDVIRFYRRLEEIERMLGEQDFSKIEVPEWLIPA